MIFIFSLAAKHPYPMYFSLGPTSMKNDCKLWSWGSVHRACDADLSIEGWNPTPGIEIILK